MTVMIATMLAAWLLLVTMPDLPVTRWLHAILVVAPVARLAGVGRGHLAIVVIAAIVIGTVAWAGEGDGLRMLTMAAPEAVTWLTTFEIATCLDVAMAAIAAWSATRLPLVAILRGTIRRRRNRAAMPTRREAANDDAEPDRRRCA